MCATAAEMVCMCADAATGAANQGRGFTGCFDLNETDSLALMIADHLVGSTDRPNNCFQIDGKTRAVDNDNSWGVLTAERGATNADGASVVAWHRGVDRPW